MSDQHFSDFAVAETLVRVVKICQPHVQARKMLRSFPPFERLPTDLRVTVTRRSMLAVGPESAALAGLDLPDMSALCPCQCPVVARRLGGLALQTTVSRACGWQTSQRVQAARRFVAPQPARA